MPQQFARRIRAARWGFLEDLDEAAQRIGMEPEALRAIEDGERMPDASEILKFCEETGCRPDFLFLGEFSGETPTQLMIRIELFLHEEEPAGK